MLDSFATSTWKRRRFTLITDNHPSPINSPSPRHSPHSHTPQQQQQSTHQQLLQQQLFHQQQQQQQQAAGINPNQLYPNQYSKQFNKLGFESLSALESKELYKSGSSHLQINRLFSSNNRKMSVGPGVKVRSNCQPFPKTYFTSRSPRFRRSTQWYQPRTNVAFRAGNTSKEIIFSLLIDKPCSNDSRSCWWFGSHVEQYTPSGNSTA